MPDVLMPRLSDSMEEGTILRWLVADGDEVTRGQEIVEIETDKATMPYEADDAGVLRIAADEGSTLAIGAVMATIGDGDGDGDGAESEADAEAGAGGGAAPGNGKTAPASTASSTTDGAGAATAAPAPGTDPSSTPGAGATAVSASPVARRTAAALGVAIESVTGSGPYGRVLKADVVAAADGDGTAPAAAPEPTAADEPQAAPAAAVAAPRSDGAKGEVTTSELSRLQQSVARRMAESKATIPDFSLTVDVDMTAAVELRARLKEVADPAPSLNDLVVKACAVVLRRHPRANGSYRDGRFETYERVNVGVAVATDDGLVVPTVTDADTRSVGSIAAEVRRLAGRVRDATITPPELAGGTFTVSNLGMFGVDRFAGVINPPQAAILCVGAVTRRPAVAPDGAIVARDLMSITLVSDHRILYGADAARFLADVREALEEPLRVLV